MIKDACIRRSITRHQSRPNPAARLRKGMYVETWQGHIGQCMRWIAEMGSGPPLLTFVVTIMSGRIHRRHRMVIEFLNAEIRTLRGCLLGKRIRFVDAVRGFLARNAKTVGRKDCLEFDSIESPVTLTRSRI